MNTSTTKFSTCSRSTSIHTDMYYMKGNWMAQKCSARRTCAGFTTRGTKFSIRILQYGRTVPSLSRGTHSSKAEFTQRALVAGQVSIRMKFAKAFSRVTILN
jgi:hypothetical protein